VANGECDLPLGHDLNDDAAREFGRQAEVLGRAVPLTVAGFRQAVLREGHDAVARALISRHNKRLERLAEISPIMQMVCLPTVTGFIELDVDLLEMGVSFRPTVLVGESWVDQLAWGLDSVAASTRFLMCMQVVGASIIARTQLERWSTNLAINVSLPQAPGEDTVAWMRRVWEFPGAQNILFWHEADRPNCFTIRPMERSVDAGNLFAELSELLHGRGELLDALWWEVDGFESPLQAEHVRSLDLVGDALTLCVKQIQGGLAGAALDAGKLSTCNDIETTPIIGPIRGLFANLLPYIWPIELRLVENDERLFTIAAAGAQYHMEVAKAVDGGTPAFPPEIAPAMAFAERRTRAYNLARAALDVEKSYLGSTFDPGRLSDVTLEAIFASEMAGLLARWTRDRGDVEVPNAFALSASSLRSGVWLWLEDDYRAMGCLRVVLEQLARIRTWRTKPEIARKLEARPQTTPRDWINKCGWNRLRVVLKALGEFAHGADPNNWYTAHDVLIRTNQGEDHHLAERTGRTSTLRNLINILQGECAAWLDDIDPVISKGYWEVIRLDSDRVAHGTELVLRSAWATRNMTTRAATSGEDGTTTAADLIDTVASSDRSE
jgi:hypothetical protein